MPGKLTYGAALLMVGAMFDSADAQLANGEYILDFPRGRGDNRTTISSSLNCGNNWLHIVNDSQVNFNRRWRVTRVGNAYTLESLESRTPCPRRFLSVSGHCGHNYVDLWFRNDNSGRQLWNLTPAANGTYKMSVAGGRGCPRNTFSTGWRSNNPDLWTHDDNSGKQQIRFTSATQDPITLPPQVQIISLGKTNNKVELSADRNCGNQQAWQDAHEDMNREHGWRAEAVPGKYNTYRFISNRNCDRKYLSVAAGCGQVYVDLWNRDDNSGRQHWQIEKIKGKDGAYTLLVGGRACNRRLLSNGDASDRVDLFWFEHNKDNQHFRVEPFAPYKPEDTDLEGINVITSLGKTDGKNFVTQNRNCANNIQLFAGQDDQSSKFRFKAIPGRQSTYSIQNLSGCARSFLSAPGNCATYVDYWFRDQNNGDQWWFIQPAQGREGAYVLKHVSKPANCARVWLSTRDVWHTADLWSANNNDNQWWGIAPFKPAEPLELPAVSQIVSLGKTDKLVELSADRNCGQQQAFLDEHVEFHREHGWKLQPVAGKLNTFNIISNRNCDRKFLSVGAGCS